MQSLLILAVKALTADYSSLLKMDLPGQPANSRSLTAGSRLTAVVANHRHSSQTSAFSGGKCAGIDDGEILIKKQQKMFFLLFKELKCP